MIRYSTELTFARTSGCRMGSKVGSWRGPTELAGGAWPQNGPSGWP